MSEKQFCSKCEYYFSEMFTCPICYGEQKATERIIKLLEDFDFSCIWRQIGWPSSYESFDAEELIALIKEGNK